MLTAARFGGPRGPALPEFTPEHAEWVGKLRASAAALAALGERLNFDRAVQLTQWVGGLPSEAHLGFLALAERMSLADAEGLEDRVFAPLAAVFLGQADYLTADRVVRALGPLAFAQVELVPIAARLAADLRALGVEVTAEQEARLVAGLGAAQSAQARRLGAEPLKLLQSIARTPEAADLYAVKLLDLNLEVFFDVYKLAAKLKRDDAWAAEAPRSPSELGQRYRAYFTYALKVAEYHDRVGALELLRQGLDKLTRD